jgi:hypothetical protein
LQFVVLRKSEKWMETPDAPDPELVAAMQRYDDEMRKAGVLVAVARVNILEVASKEEAIAWMKRCPTCQGENVEAQFEIRPVLEASPANSNPE